jgi:cytochrome c peroxidase
VRPRNPSSAPRPRTSTSSRRRALRGLAARAPYFHNGSAATLLDVINAYEAAGFQYGFSEDEKANLVAFLESL